MSSFMSGAVWGMSPSLRPLRYWLQDHGILLRWRQRFRPRILHRPMRGHDGQHANCSAARAAEAATVSVSQPGDGLCLDRDGNAVACEKSARGQAFLAMAKRKTLGRVQGFPSAFEPSSVPAAAVDPVR